MAKDYSHLEGKIVKHDGRCKELLVVGIEEDFALTCVNAADTKDKVICINGPNSPHRTENTNLKCFFAMFDYCVKAIEDGFIEVDKLSTAKQNAVPDKDALNCRGSLYCKSNSWRLYNYCRSRRIIINWSTNILLHNSGYETEQNEYDIQATCISGDIAPAAGRI